MSLRWAATVGRGMWYGRNTAVGGANQRPGSFGNKARDVPRSAAVISGDIGGQPQKEAACGQRDFRDAQE